MNLIHLMHSWYQSCTLESVPVSVFLPFLSSEGAEVNVPANTAELLWKAHVETSCLFESELQILENERQSEEFTLV